MYAESEEKCWLWRDRLAKALGVSITMIMCDPLYPVEDDADGKGFWVKPKQGREDARRKELRKQALASFLHLLNHVQLHRPRLLVGIEQGALIVSLTCAPLLLEKACRMRIATTEQMVSFRKSWAGISAAILVNPIMLPQRSQWEEVAIALPEIDWVQPRGFHRAVIQSGTSYTRQGFGDDLAASIGTIGMSEAEFMASDLPSDIKEACVQPVPVYIEDDPSGIGACGVCGLSGLCGFLPSFDLCMPARSC